MVSSISNWESTAHKQCQYIKLCWCVLSSHKRIEIQSPSRFQPVGAVDHDQCFQWFFDGVGVIQPLVSMVFNGYGPLVQQCDGFNGSFTSKLSQNWKFKLADPVVEGDPKIWHRSFWLSAVTLNKHKSMCALPLPPDLQLAGDIFGSSEWCSCLCWEVDSSCTKKIWRQKHAINSQSPKENRYPLESTIHHTTPKTTAGLYLECWLKFLLCASSTTSMDLFLDQRI